MTIIDDAQRMITVRRVIIDAIPEAEVPEWMRDLSVVQLRSWKARHPKTEWISTLAGPDYGIDSLLRAAERREAGKDRG